MIWPPFTRVHTHLRRIMGGDSGATIVEFAMVAPIFLVLLVGGLDVGHSIYARAILSGAVEAAARSSALESGDTVAADAMVLNSVSSVLPSVELTTQRTSYFDFSDIGRPERWTDSNGNDTCDNNEPFIDENRSGNWESDVGVTGNGSANDVVVYHVEARYRPIFVIPFLTEPDGERTIVATAVRKNQPYALQRSYGTSTGTCDE